MASNERIYNIFFKLVTRLRPQQFSDKRDTIYGFAGLLQAVLTPGTSSPIHADYSLSSVDVHTNQVWDMVSNMSYLDVLSRTQFVVLAADYPSWVPRWWIPFVGTNIQTVQAGVVDREQFDASKSKSPSWSFRLTEGRGLTLVGARLAAITLSDTELFPEKIGATLLKMLLKMLLGQELTYLSTAEPKDGALCRTLLGDTFSNRRIMPKDRAVFQEWWMNALGRSIALLRSEGRSGEGDIINLLGKLGSDWEWLPSLEDVLNAADSFVVGEELPSSSVQVAIHRFWIRRTFFLTEAGHFGLGPRSLDVMDEVWLLKGGRTPFALRKRANGNGYHLIGEVYVHGVMYGEAATPAFNEQMCPVTIF